jgi:hypothetical protein
MNVHVPSFILFSATFSYHFARIAEACVPHAVSEMGNASVENKATAVMKSHFNSDVYPVLRA